MGMNLPVENVESQEMEGVNISDSELVYHVREALTAALSGDNENYNQLVAVMHLNGRLGPDERALLETSLKALSGVVSYLDAVYHGYLLTSIFGMSMWNYEPDVMDALKGLIISLAASNGKYIDSCLSMLVSNLTPPPFFLDKLTLPYGRERVLSRVHAALKNIAECLCTRIKSKTHTEGEHVPVFLLVSFSTQIAFPLQRLTTLKKKAK